MNKKDDCLKWKDKNGNPRYYKTKREAKKEAKKMNTNNHSER